MMKPKMNIFMQYAYAVTNPKKYGEMVKLGAGRIFLYLLLLSVLTCILVLAKPVYTYFSLGGAANVVDDFIPEFRFNNGTFKTSLKIDKTYDMEDFLDLDIKGLESDEIAEEIQPYIIYIFAKELIEIGDDYDSEYDSYMAQKATSDFLEDIEDNRFYLFIDTSVPSVSEAVDSYIDLEEINADDIVIITRNNFTVLDKSDIRRSLSSDTPVSAFKYGNVEFDDTEFDKDMIIDAINSVMPVFYVIFFIFVIIFLISSVVGWLIAAVVYSLIALITKAVTHKTLSYGTLFKTAVYAQTTMILVRAVLSLVSLPDLPVTYIGYTVTSLYIIFAIIQMDNEMKGFNGRYQGADPYNGYNNYNGQQNNYPYGNQQQNNNYPYGNQQQNNNYPYGNQQQGNNYPYGNQQQNNDWNSVPPQNNGDSQPYTRVPDTNNTDSSDNDT